MANYYDINDIITEEEVGTHVFHCWIVLLPTLLIFQSNTVMYFALVHTGCLSRIPKGSRWSGNWSQFRNRLCKFYWNWSCTGVDGQLLVLILSWVCFPGWSGIQGRATFLACSWITTETSSINECSPLFQSKVMVLTDLCDISNARLKILTIFWALIGLWWN